MTPCSSMQQHAPEITKHAATLVIVVPPKHPLHPPPAGLTHFFLLLLCSRMEDFNRERQLYSLAISPQFVPMMYFCEV